MSIPRNLLEAIEETIVLKRIGDISCCPICIFYRYLADKFNGCEICPLSNPPDEVREMWGRHGKCGAWARYLGYGSAFDSVVIKPLKWFRDLVKREGIEA